MINPDTTHYLPDYVVQPTLDGKAHILERQEDETYRRIGTIINVETAVQIVDKANREA